MEFNRLLSSVISVYGEPKLSDKTIEKDLSVKQQPVNNKNYHLIKNPNEIDDWINNAVINFKPTDKTDEFFADKLEEYTEIKSSLDKKIS